MSPALPGARGLFSALQDALGKADRNRVRVTRHVWNLAADFTAIANSLQQRPTRLQELVPTTPSFLGASDASRLGTSEGPNPRTRSRYEKNYLRFLVFFFKYSWDKHLSNLLDLQASFSDIWKCHTVNPRIAFIFPVTNKFRNGLSLVHKYPVYNTYLFLSLFFLSKLFTSDFCFSKFALTYSPKQITSYSFRFCQKYSHPIQERNVCVYLVGEVLLNVELRISLFSGRCFRFSPLIFAIIILSFFVLSVSGNDVGDTTFSFTAGIVISVVVFTFRVGEIVACMMCYLLFLHGLFHPRWQCAFFCKWSRNKLNRSLLEEMPSSLEPPTPAC